MGPDYNTEIFFNHRDELQIQKGIIPQVPADSPEILYQCYHDKIAYLQTQLSKLTLLEHPHEIQSVCGQIIKMKKKSSVMAGKYKMLTQHPFKK